MSQHGGTDERKVDDKLRTRALSGDDFEEVLSEERKDDKTSQQQQAAAAAAGPSSPSAAAASTSSSSSSFASSASSVAASSSHARDEVEDVACSACQESFECADDSARLPRTLPCGHLLCAACIKKQLQITPGLVKCPFNQEHGEQKIRSPAGSSASAPGPVEDAVRQLPPALELIASIKNQQTLMTRLAQKGAECIHQGCKAPVTHFCSDCGDLCSTHERKRHAIESFKSHKQTTLPIAQKSASLQQQRLIKLAGPAAKIRSQATALLQQQQQLTTAAEQELKQLEVQTQLQLQKKQQEVDAKRKALSALKQTMDAMRVADDSAVVELEADRLEAEEQVAPPMTDSTILSELDDKRIVVDLQTFLGAGLALSNAKLIYRGSRDGFKAEDWWRLCAGKSNLLTIVRVKRNGFVFGAFTPFQWPAGVPTKDQPIADPTGATFLFSLVNAHGRAVKLRLKESGKAKAGRVYPNFGPFFGYNEIILMREGMSADADSANYSSSSSAVFEFDCVADGGTPIMYDKTLLAGDDGKDKSFHFAATEIESWQL